MTKHVHTVPPCGFVRHYIFMSVIEPNIYFELTRQTNLALTFGRNLHLNSPETPKGQNVCFVV